MKYLTAEELQTTHQDEARKTLGDYVGLSTRDRFAIDLFNRCHDKAHSSRSGTKILDCGAASGAFLAELHEDGYRELYGVDLDRYVLPQRDNFLREYRAVDMSNHSLPWSDGFFDAVSAWCVLPHLENPFHCVREIHRVLAPGGLFFFSVPHLGAKPSMDYFFQYKDFRSYRPTNNHIVLFPPGVIQKTIFKYFDVVAVEYHVRQKVFSGVDGRIRSLFFGIARLRPRWVKILERRWAYHVAYVLRRLDPISRP